MANRSNVEFKTRDGVTLRGWYYKGEGSAAKKPAIVMAHGFSAVKEMSLANFAEAFAKEGFNVLVYDNRCLGESEGTPRYELVPVLQIDDYKDAVTHVSTMADVDPERIGIWGSSYSGGHVLVVAAQDRRVKCVVSQVQLVNGYIAWNALPEEAKKTFAASFAADRVSRHQGNDPAMIPVTTVLPTPDSVDFFLGFQKANPENPWKDSVTLRSVEHLFSYHPGASIPHIAPTPLLMVVAKGDALVPAEASIKAFETAGEGPKKLVVVDCGHFQPYEMPHLEPNLKEQLAWFKEHLKP